MNRVRGKFKEISSGKYNTILLNMDFHKPMFRKMMFSKKI